MPCRSAVHRTSLRSLPRGGTRRPPHGPPGMHLWIGNREARPRPDPADARPTPAQSAHPGHQVHSMDLDNAPGKRGWACRMTAGSIEYLQQDVGLVCQQDGTAKASKASPAWARGWQRRSQQWAWCTCQVLLAPAGLRRFSIPCRIGQHQSRGHREGCLSVVSRSTTSHLSTRRVSP